LGAAHWIGTTHEHVVAVGTGENRHQTRPVTTTRSGRRTKINLKDTTPVGRGRRRVLPPLTGCAGPVRELDDPD
jgi:hypothetical protein